MMMTGSSFDYDKLCQEAQNRWLKPSEILFILLNHESFPVDLETPKKPSSGSLFLFNRRVHRNFRKDGHAWKKKKDGRAVGEAHERLKVGNVDTLSCYYAHGELNPYFQRRSYWMLDPACDHIVLVHYREVSEGRFLPPLVSQPPQEQLISLNESLIDDNVQFQGSTTAVRDIYDYHQSFDCSISGEVNSNYFEKNLDAGCLKLVNISENYDLSLHTEVKKALRELEEQLSLEKCDNNISDDLFPANSNDFVKLENPALRELEEQLSLDKCDNNISDDLFPANSNDFVKLENPAFLDNERGNSLKKLHENLIPVLQCSGYDQGFNGKQKSQTLVSFHGIFRKNSPSWIDILEHSSSSTRISADVRDSASLAFASISEPSCYTSNATGTQDLCGNALKFKNDFQQISDEKNKFSAPFDWLEQFSLTHPDEHQQQQNLRQPGNTGENAEPNTRRSDLSSQFSAGTTGIGPNSTMASAQKESSIDRMGTLELPNEIFSYSSDLFGLWFDQGQHGVSLATESSLTMAKKQLFRIHEISPEWSFSFEKTKVFIIGDFLCYPSLNAWAVMFGDTEVPAEIVRPGVLYCQSPEHATGKVAICITSRNKESCSEVREFEFRTKHVYSSMETVQHLNPNKKSEELLLLVKFVHLLLCQQDFVASKRTSQRELEYDWKMNATEEQWLRIIDQLQGGCEPSGAIDWIVQELVKDKFQQWILHKIRSTEDKSFLLSRKEQGIIHLISGLGYEWALTPILDNGVGINFRDANGWTALHWAARFGREKMAAALLAAGALAGAVTDPTPHDPMGKTAGAIASACGHKGLAGYLSEADLTSHLSSLAMKEYEISKGSAAVVAEKAVENISERTVHLHGGDGAQVDLSLQDSLAAVRNAAQAAARIQAAFRAHSFRKRREQTARIHDNEYGIAFGEMYSRISLSKNQRAAHIYRDQKFDKAALSIQKQYRGWKGRKDFLTLRQHVVKIQAHVRGHQARKKYIDFLWTVGVLEKLVLRWRRRGVGLRGFRPEPILVDEEDIIKVFRKQKVDVALDQAYKRVLSMVESPSAREQYRRMLESFQEAKAEQGSSEEAMSKPRDDA